MSIIFLFVPFAFALLMIAGILLLQIFLSKAESKYLGLILPGITLFFDLIRILRIIPAILSYNSGIVIIPNLLLSLPSIILLTIYFTCRSKLHKATKLDEMKQMNIKDL